jgi:uncharacterized protein (DUF1697 family)
MKTYISLLRGINVGGENRIGMPELKRLCESIGLRDVVTYIQSGNVVFSCDEKDPAKIAILIETGIKQSFESDVRVILREKDSLERILTNNPYINHRKTDHETLYVTFLSEAPTITAINKANAARDVDGSDYENYSNSSPEDDEFIIYGTEVYLYCLNGYGKTKFSNTFFEKKLSVSATTRNWKTVNALYELAKRRRT